MCSGVDLDLIQECSNGEQNKYAGIGATVFFTALMAATAGSYALYTVFDNIAIALLFGVIWGLLIFNLDRFIVSTIRKNTSKTKEILQVIPRLILAVIIAIVISKPLELKIFEKEINQVLLTQKNAMTLANKTQIAQQFTPEIDRLKTEILGLKNEIVAKEMAVDTLYATYIAEAEGRKGTKLLGKGPVYKEKRQKHDTALAELNALRTSQNATIKDKENTIRLLTEQQKNDELKTQPIISNFDGLMARIEALNILPWLPSFFIFLLFLAIETAPIFTKLISDKGMYDYKLDHQDTLFKNALAQEIYQSEALKTSDQQITDKVYSELQSDKDTYLYKQKIAKDILHFQANTFYKNQQ